MLAFVGSVRLMFNRSLSPAGIFITHNVTVPAFSGFVLNTISRRLILGGAAYLNSQPFLLMLGFQAFKF